MALQENSDLIGMADPAGVGPAIKKAKQASDSDLMSGTYDSSDESIPAQFSRAVENFTPHDDGTDIDEMIEHIEDIVGSSGEEGWRILARSKFRTEEGDPKVASPIDIALGLSLQVDDFGETHRRLKEMVNLIVRLVRAGRSEGENDCWLDTEIPRMLGQALFLVLTRSVLDSVDFYGDGGGIVDPIWELSEPLIALGADMSYVGTVKIADYYFDDAGLDRIGCKNAKSGSLLYCFLENDLIDEGYDDTTDLFQPEPYKLKILDLLVAAGADPTWMHPISGETLLHVAVRRNYNSIVNRLIPLLSTQINAAATNLPNVEEKDLDVATKKDGAMETALMRACRRGNVDVVKSLLGAAADASLASGSGETALHVACAEKQSVVALLLLEHSPEVRSAARSRKNQAGVTPLALATTNELKDVTFHILREDPVG